MSTPKPKPQAPVAKSDGRLEWRALLHWLLEDGLIDDSQVQRTEQRFAAGDSSLHPVVRLGHANLVRLSTGKPLDVDALSEWLALRAKLPYLRIDPLKVDVGRVAEVMSISYAERRKALSADAAVKKLAANVCPACEPPVLTTGTAPDEIRAFRVRARQNNNYRY